MKRRIIVILAAVAGLGCCSAAAYSLAPSSPASCWIQGGLVHHNVHPGWQIQACIFERVKPDGSVIEQIGLARLDANGIPGPTEPMRPVTPRPIFHDPARN